MDAVFAQLNQGDGITSGLKKVDDTEKTHKNPQLRDAGKPAVVSSGSVSGRPPVKPPKPGSAQKKPPKTELDGNKWLIVHLLFLPSFVLLC